MPVRQEAGPEGLSKNTQLGEGVPNDHGDGCSIGISRPLVLSLEMSELCLRGADEHEHRVSRMVT